MTAQTYTTEELAAMVIRESSYLYIMEVSGKFKQETYRYRIVEDHGVLLDMTTAGFIQQFLAHVAPDTKAKLLSLPMATLVSFIYKHI
jgi:hypothetical protein